MPEKLRSLVVEKPWGVADLPPGFAPPGFGDAQGRRIGEIWHQSGDPDLPLLVKHIFTDERLSIQVHPDDQMARSAGFPHGKDEAWYILDCMPGATIGLGLKQAVSAAAFRAAALDGTVETLIDWKPIAPGDFIYVPAGTIHAIGAGISLIEVQRNVDVTYRLFDYGRPRALHLDQGLEAGRLAPYAGRILATASSQTELLDGNDSQPFWVRLYHASAREPIALSHGGPAWFIPISGGGTINDEAWRAGECWLVDGDTTITTDGPASALVAGMA